MPLLDQIYARREEILKLARECGIREVMVFGSVARGEETPESDLDVLVECDPDNCSGWDVFGFPGALEGMFGRRVDMVFKSGLYHVIRDDVLREARPV